MAIVLYLDNNPLLLSNIERKSPYGRITQGEVINGRWLLKLGHGTNTAYAFEEFNANRGWGDKLILRNEFEYETYEEVEVNIPIGIHNYNEIIDAADKILTGNNA